MYPAGRFHVLLLISLAALVVVARGEASLASNCSTQVQKVTACLPYATAKASEPTAECCGAVTDMRRSNAACLCYIIQQIHNGTNEAIKSMGIQEPRLLQLPSACKLVNASVTECPRLLHLPPNSPDAAIFTNASTAAPGTPIATPGGTSSPAAAAAILHKPQLGKAVIFVGVIFLAVRTIPTGILIFC